MLAATRLWNFVLSLVVILALDAVWLGIMAPSYMGMHQGLHCLGSHIDMWAAVLAYLLLGVALAALVEKHERMTYMDKFWCAAFWGFVIYGVYNLTNKATLKGWRWDLSVVDTVWGTVLFGLGCVLVCWLKRLLH